jgi:hypothetical protein
VVEGRQSAKIVVKPELRGAIWVRYAVNGST